MFQPTIRRFREMPSVRRFRVVTGDNPANRPIPRQIQIDFGVLLSGSFDDLFPADDKAAWPRPPRVSTTSS